MANKKRLIDANALIDTCRSTLMVDVFPNWRNMTNEEKNIATKLGGAFRRIHENTTTVDAVEVVRCKDCTQWCRNVGIVDSPNGHCYYHEIDMNGFDFCSYGERKDNG